MIAIEKLKAMNMRLTPQRIAILEFFDGNKKHPSADDVYEAVHKAYPTLSVATVYTTLASLRDRGIIRELALNGNKKRYDPDTSDHHHIVCTNCKRIFDFEGDIEVKVPGSIQKEFRIMQHHVEMRGICPDCTK